VTAAERRKAFLKERAAQLKRLSPLMRKTYAEALAVMETAKRRIREQLAAAPTDWQSWHLPQLASAVESALSEAAAEVGRLASTGQSSAWQMGADLVSKPLVASGLIEASLTSVSTQQLTAMQSFTTSLIKDASRQTISKINTELGLSIVGAQNTSQTIGRVSQLVDGGRSRAMTIVRTEMSRAYSTANQTMLNDVAEDIPGLRKQWRRSGKLHGRVDHRLADGQIRKVDEPFDVGGVKIMYPCAPGVPAKHAVNCGCVSLPYVADWEVKHPKDVPAGRKDLQSESGRFAAEIRAHQTREWISQVITRETKASGEFRTVGSISGQILDKLALKGVSPVSSEIGLADKRVLHMVRSAKRAKLPAAEIVRLPVHLASPQAVLWDKNKKNLLYVFKVKGEARYGVLPVELRDRDGQAKGVAHNWVQTGGLVEAGVLRTVTRYEVLSGTL